MKSICVFCGSSNGREESYRTAAKELAALLCRREKTLIYGGASVGVMATLADAVLAEGGKVVGVMPQSLRQREVAHEQLTELHITQSMHDRKAMMYRLADAFIALPGGVGTLEELFEVWTHAQLGFHQKPIGLLNVDGYFDKLLDFIDHCVEHQFVVSKHRSILLVESEAASLLDRFQQYVPPVASKWT